MVASSQAAMAMQAYSDWAPKELDEDAIGKEAPQPATSAAAEAAAPDGSVSAAAAAADGAAAVGATPADGTAAAAPEAAAAQQQAAQFEYDPATGERRRRMAMLDLLLRPQPVRLLWLTLVLLAPDRSASACCRTVCLACHSFPDLRCAGYHLDKASGLYNRMIANSCTLTPKTRSASCRVPPGQGVWAVLRRQQRAVLRQQGAGAAPP